MGAPFVNPIAVPERHYQVTVDTAALLRLEGGLRRWAGVVGTQSERAKGFPGRIGDSWRGATATAVKDEMTGLGQVLAKGKSLIDKAADAVLDFRTEIETIVQSIYLLELQWQDAHRDYLGQMNSDVVGPFDSEAERGEAKAKKEARAEAWWARDSANYDLRFAKHQKSLVNAARDFVRALRECQLVTLPGALADTARFSASGVTPVGLPYAAHQLSPQLKLVEKYQDQGWGLFSSREEAEADGRRIAQLRNDGSELSPTDRELLAKAAKHPWFAHAYVVKRGARNLALAPSVAATKVHDSAVRTPAMSAPELAALQAEQEQVLDAEAMALSTSSASLGGKFAQEMVDLATKDKAAAYGVSILMHRGGDYAPAFADVLTEGISQADKKQGKAATHGLAESWAPLYGKPEWADPMTGVEAMQARAQAKADQIDLKNESRESKESGQTESHIDRPERPRLDGDTARTSSDHHENPAAAGPSAPFSASELPAPTSPTPQDAPIAGPESTPTSPPNGIPGASTPEGMPAIGHLSPEMRNNVARIISAQLVNFDGSLVDGPPGGTHTDSPAGATLGQPGIVPLSRAELKELIATVVNDPDAVACLLNSELVLVDASLHEAGEILHGKNKDITAAEAKKIYFSVLSQHEDLLRFLEAAVAKEKADQGGQYAEKIKVAIDAWQVIAQSGASLKTDGIELTKNTTDSLLMNSPETVAKAVAASHGDLMVQDLGAQQSGLVDRLSEIAVRRAFEDDLYFTGLLENPRGLSRSEAQELPFLDEKLHVKENLNLTEQKAFTEFLRHQKSPEVI